MDDRLRRLSADAHTGNGAARWEGVQIRNTASELHEQGSLPERFVAVLERIPARPC